MKKYVAIVETYRKIVAVDAETDEEAEEKVDGLYADGDVEIDKAFDFQEYELHSLSGNYERRAADFTEAALNKRGLTMMQIYFTTEDEASFPEWRLEELRVCVCLKTLYESHIQEGEDEAFTDCGFSIRMEESSEEGNPYYDLYDANGGRRLCCDGEPCRVVRMEPGRITLISDSANEDEETSDKEFQFVLSEAEYKSCT